MPDPRDVPHDVPHDVPDWAAELRARLAGTSLPGADEADVVEEMAQHLDDRYRDLLRRAVPPDEARRRTLAELLDGGALAAMLERARPRRPPELEPLGLPARGGWLGGVWRDLRYAGRALRLTPVFAAAALLTLGLGVGAATAAFSLVEGVVLRPLPYARPDRLVMLWEGNQEKELARQPLSPVNLVDYRALSRVFDDVAAWWRPEVSLVDDRGEPIRVPAVEASDNLFRVLGVRAALGRTFVPTPTLFGPEAEAVISDRLWRTRFGGDPAVIGRTVRLNGYPYAIVGVMPAGFALPAGTDVWQRLQWDLQQHSRAAHFVEAVGRLRAGVTAEQADRELAGLSTRLAAEFPRTNAGWSARTVALDADVAGVFRPGLLALFGASGLLLLIACINVANLLLARSAARRAEIAVRAALGATRARLVRQMLAESLVLGALGATLGILVAWGAVRGFLAWTPVPIPRADDVAIDGTVLAFAAALAFATTLLFGLAPALLASRGALGVAMRHAGRGAAGARVGRRGRGALVAAEVALAVALLCGAGLLIRTVGALLRETTGVAAPERALAVDVQLPDGVYEDWPRVARFWAELMPALRARAGITSAGAANVLPPDAGWRVAFAIEGAPPPASPDERMAQYVTADEGYFHALGARLLGGRTFEPRDDERAPGVVVVNEAMARRFWPGESAVGKRIVAATRGMGPLGRRLTAQPAAEVIGVVSDVKNSALTAEPEPAMYWSARQFPFRKMHLVVRGAAAPSALAEQVRAEVRRLDPALPLGEARPLDRVLGASVDPPRLVMLLMSAFAALALALAAVGIYGIMAYTVSHRRRELGLRLALGARPGDVMGMVVREALSLAGAGALAGVVVAAAGGRLLAGLLYGVRPADPATMLAVVAVVLGVALAACVAPGRRAALTDPARTLRDD